MGNRLLCGSVGVKLFSQLGPADYSEARARLGLPTQLATGSTLQSSGVSGTARDPIPAEGFSSPEVLQELRAAVAVAGPTTPSESGARAAPLSAGAVEAIAALASRHPRDPVVRAVEGNAWAGSGHHERAARAYARGAILLAGQSDGAALHLGHLSAHHYQLAGDREAAVMVLEGFQEQWSGRPTPSLDLALAGLDRHAEANTGRALHGTPGSILDADAMELDDLDRAADGLLGEFGERVTQLRRLSHAMARLSSQDQLELRGPAVVSLAARATTSKSPLLQPAAGLPIDHAYETGQVVRPENWEIDLRPPRDAGSDDLWPGVTRRRRGDGAAEAVATPRRKFASLAADEAQLWEFVDSQSEEISGQLTALAAAIDPEGERTQQILTLPPESESDQARQRRARQIFVVRIAALIAGILLLFLLATGADGALGYGLLFGSLVAGAFSVVLGARVWSLARGAAAARREHLRYEAVEDQRRAAEEVIRRDRMVRISEVRDEVAQVEGELRTLRRARPLLPQPLVLPDGLDLTSSS